MLYDVLSLLYHLYPASLVLQPWKVHKQRQRGLAVITPFKFIQGHRLLVKFALLTGGTSLKHTRWRWTPKLRTIKFDLKKLETSPNREVQKRFDILSRWAWFTSVTNERTDRTGASNYYYHHHHHHHHRFISHNGSTRNSKKITTRTKNHFFVSLFYGWYSAN